MHDTNLKPEAPSTHSLKEMANQENHVHLHEELGLVRPKQKDWLPPNPHPKPGPRPDFPMQEDQESPFQKLDHFFQEAQEKLRDFINREKAHPRLIKEESQGKTDSKDGKASESLELPPIENLLKK